MYNPRSEHKNKCDVKYFYKSNFMNENYNLINAKCRSKKCLKELF